MFQVCYSVAHSELKQTLNMELSAKKVKDRTDSYFRKKLHHISFTGSAQKIKFSFKDFFIVNGKLHILCSVSFECASATTVKLDSK